MVRSYQTEGLVLKRIKKGEADSYYSLLSRKHGLIRVIAKGVRKINSRRAPFLDLFNHLVVFLAKGKNLDIITDVTPIESFNFLKTQLSRVASAFKAVEITERVLPEGVPHVEIFDKLINVFKFLNQKKEIDEKKTVDTYAVFLLQNLGYITNTREFQGKELDETLEEIMEKKIKTNILLSKLV